MNWGLFTRVALGIALVVGVIALGTGVYQAGFAAGVATEGSVAVAPVAPVTPVYAGYGWGFHWGFPSFGFFGFLLFLFLLFGLLRLIFGGGRGRGYGYGPGPAWGYGGRHHDQGPDAPANGGAGSRGAWESRSHSVFDEWHRQAHDPSSGLTTPPPDDTATR